MSLKSIFLANAIAGAVASPASLHKRQDVDSYIQAEKPVALQGVLNNFGPEGNLSCGAAPGIPVAGNSETNPPYIYTWTRDSGLTMQSLIRELLTGNTSLKPLIQQYITSQADIQAITNPSGPLSDGSGPGEPKFNINLTAYTGPWGRPQREGPAVRASALVAYGNYLLSQGQRNRAVQNVWPVLRNDLTYVGQYRNQADFDLWEEVNRTSFFTAAVQHKALVEGQAFADALGQTCDGCAVAPELLCHLQEYWNGTAIVSNNPTANDPKGRSGVDINSVPTAINTFDPAAGCEDVTFQPCSARALLNHKVLVDSFRAIYGVNHGRTAGQAAAVGKYPEDVFMGGNPWYLATLAFAEMLYDALNQWDHQHTIHITDLSPPHSSRTSSPVSKQLRRWFHFRGARVHPC